MYDSKRTVAVLVAAMTVVGFAVAPTAVVAAGEGGLDADESTTGNETAVQTDHGPFPHEICTDLLAMLDKEAPYDQLVWVSDLPEELQPPGVPWTVVTPSAIGGIIVAVTPNHCEAQDPNDPSWDPTREGDNVDPDGNADVQPGEDGNVLVIVNGTLDNSSEGPGALLEADLELTENGTIDPDSRLNDGEKDYGVDPRLQYWSDGTTYFETDVYVFGSRLGAEMDCFGEECNTETRGLPKYADPPDFPSVSDSERPDDGSDGSDDGSGSGDGSDGSDGESSDGGPDSSGSDDGADSSDGGGSDDGADSSDGGGSDDGADGASGDSDDSDADGSNDGSDGASSDSDGSSDGNDGDGGSADDQQNQQQSGDDGGNQAAQAAAADGTGLGILVALVVFILGAAAIAPRD